MNTLHKSDVEAAIPCHPWLDRMILLDEVDSTNLYAKRLAHDGAPEGTAVIAARQSAGRGRLGRTFVSAEGGLYMSVILRPQQPPEKLRHLTAAAAVAAMRSIEESCGLKTQIKWMNDLLCGGKKLCGILSETSFCGAQPDFVVIGVGVNANQTVFPPEIADLATSIRLQTGRQAELGALAGNLLHCLYALSLTHQTHRESWLRRYREACVTVGRDVRLICGDEIRPAHADGIGDSGELLVTFPDGTRQAVFSGEASVRGLSGYGE